VRKISIPIEDLRPLEELEKLLSKEEKRDLAQYYIVKRNSNTPLKTKKINKNDGLNQILKEFRDILLKNNYVFVEIHVASVTEFRTCLKERLSKESFKNIINRAAIQASLELQYKKSVNKEKKNKKDLLLFIFSNTKEDNYIRDILLQFLFEKFQSEFSLSVNFRIV